MKKILFFCLWLTILSCSQMSRRTSYDNLVFKHYLFFEKDAHAPFTGITESKFENGNISNVIRFKNGVPDGEWAAYGYQGEIVQSGKYTPVYPDTSTYDSVGKIERINICFFQEGDYKYNDILVVVKGDVMDGEKDNLKQKVMKQLILYQPDLQIGVNDSLTFVKDELEILK